MFKCTVPHNKLVICVHETGEICPAIFGKTCTNDENSSSLDHHLEQKLEYPSWMRLDKSTVEKIALSTILEDHNNGNFDEGIATGDSGISLFDNNRIKTPYDLNSLYQKSFQERSAREEVLQNGFTPEMARDFKSMSLDPLVRAKQEQELRVRNFLPPEAHEPEIFLLEKNRPDNNELRVSNGTEESNSSRILSAQSNYVSGDPDAERKNLQNALLRLKKQRKQEENMRDALLNKAKELRSRAESHKEKLAVLWIDKFNEEKLKTTPLDEVINALRKELDEENKKRMDTFDLKMKPIIIKDGPSRKANYKIAAAKLHYEIYEMSVRLRHTALRAEQEEQIRELCEAEVKRLREEISEKKLAITTVTKGIPSNRIEVRPEFQLPQVTDPYLLLQSYHRIPTFSMISTRSSFNKHHNMTTSSKNTFKPLPSTSSSGSKYVPTSNNGQHG
uniref:Spermatogenesis-associated protein 1 C-terminal domain-containing protein n=1 Tax=Lepeophtheirus salmonis TaxID=72036 RepID=A0A0K2T2L4_LEPSM